MSEKLNPCPFCGTGEYQFDEFKHWTGQRYILLKVRLRHWRADGDTQIQVTKKTEQLCIESWNEMSGRNCR